jgi:NAD(P)-dependent dehydrogenase (short-subunit alcohol dehydrogenase family)
MALDPSAALLTDKIAVVTGAAQGIGASIAETFARFGADLALCDREPEGLARTAAACEAAGRRVITEVLDVRDEPATTAFMGRVRDELGRVDVLVNNAGGTFSAPFVDASPSAQRKIVDLNFTSVTRFIRGAVPLMDRGGSIINVTSIEAHRAGPSFAIYSAMKAAVAQLTMSLALELGDQGIRVTCIAPDLIASPSLVPPPPGTGIPRGGEPDECAGAAVFLASDLSSYVTGSTIHVDGGNWAAGTWRRVPAPVASE